MYYRPDDFAVADAVSDVAKQRGVKPAQIALAWVLHSPGITAPIVGATKAQQLTELIGAVEIKLADAEIAALEKPYKPHGILGHAQPTPKSMAK
jgi:aryl-alcohol dehydrogenase (NADP+)